MNEKRPAAKKSPLTISLILIGVGILFIVGRFVDFGGFGNLWPLFLLIPVIPLSATVVRDPRGNAGALIPLVILTFLCIYFLWLNYSDWGRVASTWPNFILAPGLGVLASWLITRDRGQLVSASILIVIGLVMYGRIIMGRIGLQVDRFVLFGILLIVGGAVVILSRGRRRKGGDSPD